MSAPSKFILLSCEQCEPLGRVQKLEHIPHFLISNELRTMQHRWHSGSLHRFVLDLSSPREQARSVPWNRNCSLGDMNVRQKMLDRSESTRSLEQIVTHRFWQIIDDHWPVLIIWYVKTRWRYNSKNCLYSRLPLVGMLPPVIKLSFHWCMWEISKYIITEHLPME